MASGVTLKMKFDTMRGSRTWTIKNFKPSATSQQVKTLGQAMIDNGSVYETVPVTLVSATKIVTEESEYDLN